MTYKIQVKLGLRYYDHATLNNMDKDTAEYWLNQVREINKLARIVKE